MIKTAAVFSLIVNRKSLIALIFTFSIFLFQFSIANARPAHAQDCNIPDNATSEEIINAFNKCAIEKGIFDDKIFNFNQIAGTIDSLNTHILGISQLHPETNTLTQGKGALSATAGLVAGLYSTPPASGVDYFAQKIQEFNPVQPAYAQEGKGFEALSPVQPLWRVFRNASYVGFVIVFVIMGFMIMFRAHISPQAVATVQDSIPRIVVALILVTFSYALAGLMIDLMFLAINIAINLFAQSGFIRADEASHVIFDKSIFGVILDAWGDIFGTTALALHDLIDSVVDLNFGGDILGILEWGIEWGVGGIAALIVGIAALFIMFRIFLMLLMAYVMIIILTMFAPFFFLIQALPGNNGAKEWFKQMAANVAVFPAVAFMIIFAGIIGGISAFGGTGAGELSERVAGESLKFPLLSGGFNPTAIGKLIAIGFLLMTPEAANMVKKFVSGQGGGGGGFAPGAAIGAAIGAGAAPVGAFGRGAAGAAVTRSPIGGWRRAQEAKRQEQAQLAAGLKTYTHPEGAPPKPTK